MKEEKSFWEKLKRWIDGDEVLLDADEIISKKEKKEFIYEERIFPIGDIRSNVTLYCVLSVFVTVVFIAVMLHVVMELPMFGDPSSITNNEVAARYLEKGIAETGAINFVAGMILDYRAFDTFGESNVLFIATITVLILLRIDKKEKKEGDSPDSSMTQSEAEANDRIYEPKNDLILQKVAGFLVPLIMIFGIYVILNGHLSPGGGFSGGAIIGAGLILYLNAFGFAKTERFFTEKTYKWICFGALTCYCLAKSYSFYMGANHLESGIPLGTPGAILSSGLILVLNICVGLVVTCTMYAFYALFRKGGF